MHVSEGGAKVSILVQTVVSLCLPLHQLEQELVTMETIPLVFVQSCWCEAFSLSWLTSMWQNLSV